MSQTKRHLLTALRSGDNLFQVKIQGQNDEMLAAACQQFLGKSEEDVREIATETLEGHQRAIMGNITVEVLSPGSR